MAEEAKIVQYTTPTLEIKIKNSINLSEFREIHVTFAQGGTVVDIDSPNILSENTLSVGLTQEQTAKFSGRQPIGVMVNLIDYSGHRFANKDPIYVKVVENLLKLVIP